MSNKFTQRHKWRQDTCGEELQQEIPGIKNPPRRTTARNTRCQESAEKKTQKKKMASRHPPRRNPAQEEE